jgi:hypothetical protein
MPDLDDTSYSRSATIAAVRSYYQFLISMYLPSCSLIEPPSTGWPNITRSNFPDFNKTDEVFALLRHLPYLNTATESIPEGQFANYASFGNTTSIAEITESFADADLDDDEIEVPAHIVGLTNSLGQFRPLILLDTELGVIYWPNCHGRIKYTGPERFGPDGYGLADLDLIPEDQALWRSIGACWAVEDFFEMLKFHWRALYFLPIGDDDCLMAWNRDGSDGGSYGPEGFGQIEGLQRVWKQCGWPGEGFDRKSCFQRVRGYLRGMGRDVGYPGAEDKEEEEE